MGVLKIAAGGMFALNKAPSPELRSLTPKEDYSFEDTGYFTMAVAAWVFCTRFLGSHLVGSRFVVDARDGLSDDALGGVCTSGSGWILFGLFRRICSSA